MQSKGLYILLITAVFDPLLHYGVVGVQVDGDVLVVRVQHVTQLLQAAVLRATTRRVSQVVDDVRHVHFTWGGGVFKPGVIPCDGAQAVTHVECLDVVLKEYISQTCEHNYQDIAE